LEEKKMNYRTLGWTGLELTTIGLGTWAIGGGDWDFAWGPQDDEQSISTIHRALDLGINWIDTAAVYGLGHSEEIIGKALEGMQEKPLIATKCSRRWHEDGSIYGDMTRASILREAEESLRRLQIEVIDLYQIHWADPEEGIEEAWGAIDELMQSGKVRYAGVSNFTVDHMNRIQPIHPIASQQPPYSLLRRRVEEEILPYCAENDIGVIVYSPLQKGMLTGKVNADWVANLPEDDHRKRDPYFQGEKLVERLKIIEGLKAIAKGKGRSLAQLAIAWTLRRPEVTAAIVGAREPSQIEETVQAGSWDLSEEEITTIDALLR
jgi:aryl-alcohol dehydrogenase-like predicted oxidoreductase